MAHAQDVDELLSIGEFSARCGLSAKRLRSYAAAGLLVPAAVDARSGYRYYSTGQLNQARIIALLRRAGIAVDDIASFLARPDASRLERWDREIVRVSAVQRHALAEARAALALDRAPPSPQPITEPKGSDATNAFVAGAATHRGGRDFNQDAVLVGDGLFAVADGLGGLADGEVASRLALDMLDAAFATDRSLAGLLRACHEANQAVWRQDNREEATMGTTVVALALTSDTATVALHAGDSRLYRLRAGEISRAQAQTHPHRYVLTRAIGSGPEVDVDYQGVSGKPGDRLVLCTDGLYKALSADEMRAVLAAQAKPQESADELVTTAVGRRTDGNVTAMVVNVQ
jgi:protein phosphatase